MEKETDFLNDINTALEKNVLKIRSRQSDFLLSVILNSVMASFISIISELEDGLEDLEEQLLSPEQADMLGIENIQQYRRNFQHILFQCRIYIIQKVCFLFHKSQQIISTLHNGYLLWYIAIIIRKK